MKVRSTVDLALLVEGRKPQVYITEFRENIWIVSFTMARSPDTYYVATSRKPHDVKIHKSIQGALDMVRVFHSGNITLIPLPKGRAHEKLSKV